MKCGAYLRKGTTNAKLEKRGVSETVFVDGSIQSVHDKIIDYFNSIKAKIVSKKLPKRITVELEEQNGLTKATIRVEENYGFDKKKWILGSAKLSKTKS